MAMSTVTRIASAEPQTIGTADGYVYRWTEPGEAIDVAPQHRAELLSLPGMSRKRVRVTDPPPVRPTFLVDDDEHTVPDTLVPAPAVDDGPLDLSGATIEDDPEDDPEDDLEEQVPASTLVPPSSPPAAADRPEVVVGDEWSDADTAHLLEQRPELQP